MTDADRLTLQIQDERAAPEELAELTMQLRRDLLELDVEDVELAPAEPPPPGSRGIDAVALGSLIVSVAKPEVLGLLVATVRSWLVGHGKRSIKLEIGGDLIEVSGVSSQDQRRLIDDWLQRNTSG